MSTMRADDARLWLSGCSLMGAPKYKPIDKQPLEERLPALGVFDRALHADLADFRQARKSLVHEKPVPLSMDTSPTRTAQAEAAKAVALMYRVEEALEERAT